MLHGSVILLTTFHSVPLSVVLSTALEKVLCPDDSYKLSDTISINIFVGFLTNTKEPAPFSLNSWFLHYMSLDIWRPVGMLESFLSAPC